MPDDLEGFIDNLGRQGRRVAFDAATAPARLTQVTERAGGKAELKPDPITLMKAVKNPVELAGARAAHERDGAAMARFLAWFAGEAPRGRLREIDAVKALETFRRESPRPEGHFLPDHRRRRDRIRPSPTIGSANPPTVELSAAFFSSTAARNTKTARPTSPVRSRSGGRPA